MNDRRQFRRDSRLEVAPGTVIAEFASGTLALQFMKFCLPKGYTVTAGVNLPFAVRKRLESDAEATVEDAVPQVPTPSVPAGSFSEDPATFTRWMLGLARRSDAP
jgi:hypothetical protein